jgi:hypothetical protein
VFPVKKAIAGVLVTALAAAAGAALYWSYAAYQARSQQRAVAALVGEATARLRQDLAGGPSADGAKRIDATLETLRAMRTSRQKPLAYAAENYLLGARGIIQRRSEAVALAQRAAASRQALAAHMSSPRGRDDGWIQRATALKKHSDQVHSDLALQLKTLTDLLEELPDAERSLAPAVDQSLLLEDSLREAALQRAQDDARRAADALAAQQKMLNPR